MTRLYSRTLFFTLAGIAAGCGNPAQQEPTTVSRPAPETGSPNKAILDEVNHDEAWFRARKVKPIWARKLDFAQTVTTLEGDETVQAGDFLCRGEAGDIWPQKADKLAEKYDATEETDAEGWRKYLPKPDAEGVLAAEIDHAFTVQASWGQLQGKPSDLLVKSYADRDAEYPQDVWIVDKALFQATYQRTEE